MADPEIPLEGGGGVNTMLPKVTKRPLMERWRCL